MRFRIDGLVFVAIGLIVVMAASLISDRGGSASAQAQNISGLTPTAVPASPNEADSTAFTAPYDRYTITQGPHGFWYGHMAVDLAAGKDTPIKSPINGTVTDLFVDQWGNPNLVIENDVFQVTLLHGSYSVPVGATIALGQEIGVESNIGYTTDMQGNSCAGRNCGYHTHLNVFDKRLGENINPLDIIRSK